MILVRDGREERFTVCGIYANVFNGGKTAKATFEDTTAPTIWTDISIKLKDSTKLTKNESIQERFAVCQKRITQSNFGIKHMVQRYNLY